MPRKRPVADETGSEALKHLKIDDTSSDSDPSDTEPTEHVTDAFLDTICRNSLDFDFEEQCSVSLSTTNIYACLVCGKYFQGRGQQTHAYFHSINDEHHVFINLKTLHVYVLPDNYEVMDKSLNDIKDVIQPTYSTRDIMRIDDIIGHRHDLMGRPYTVGCVGLNRVKRTSYINVIIQTLAHIRPIRNFLLTLSNLDEQPPLVRKLSMVVRRMWHAWRFKAHISPHECVQEIVVLSKGRFGLDEEADPFELLVWMLNTLHGMVRKKKTSVVYETVRGEMQVATRKVQDVSQDDMVEDVEATISTMPFLALSLELPPTPLFTNQSTDDEDKQANIPQVALGTLLQRYDGTTMVETNGLVWQYTVTNLPMYIVCHVKRFTKHNMLEKNLTVVNFPVRNVPFGDLLHVRGSTSVTYDLVVNVCHVGHQGKSAVDGAVLTEFEESPFFAYVRQGENSWFRVHDLWVEPVMPQMLFLSDSYIQVWQRN
ncbi:U4 U6.U5 tri-snRNP-associated protein [Coemansia sp. RSA 1591]|nr:U4 U6.U5 tri-snRNP-associated protein [Coemansia sp. RSA 1591]KAJ1785091.1 U4 U6.U5 tri-snRNP-associated protein [Coemansia sp. RSA 1938]KAJ2446110.1 U4 U6.U5 tri-snRNP-associated protein [Coemansia sp. RSA 2440]